MKANIGIPLKHLEEISQILSHILADEFVLYTKTRNAHWNIEGPNFHSLHTLFESQYNEIAEIVDTVAERIRILGNYAPATLKQFLALTQLKEKTEQNNDNTNFIKDLLVDHEAIIAHIRIQMERVDDPLKDAGTVDLLAGLITYHEKVSWVLRSHL